MSGYDDARPERIARVGSLANAKAGKRGAAAVVSTELPVFSEWHQREFDKSPWPMRIFDHDTLRYLAVNDASLKLYGYTKEEFLALTAMDTRHPDEHATLLASIKESTGFLRHRGPRRHVKKSGEVIVLEVVTQDIIYNGHMARLAMSIDVTERVRMHELLKKREQEFETLAENLPDVVARFDHEHRYLYVNAAVEGVSGVSRDRFVGRTMRELGLPESLARAYDESLDTVFASGRPHDFELASDTPQGRRLFDVHHMPEKGPDGKMTSALCVAHDITGLKEKEDEVRRQKDLFAAILDNLPVGVFIRDAKTLRYVMRNRFLEESNGYAVDTSVGKTAHDLFPKHQADISVATDRRVLESGKMLDVSEQEMLGRSGDTRIFHVRKVPLPGGDGEPLLLVGIADDITERKQAEDLLRESEERFRLLAENIRTVFWINTQSGDHIHYVSPAYEEIWGRTRGSLYGDPRSWMESIHPDDLPAVRAGQLAIKRGERTDIEYRIARPDGKTRWIRDRSYPMSPARGPKLVCGIAEDVTDAKLAEQEKLDHAMRQRDALVREVRHRIKNSLQGVAGLLRQKVRKYPAIAPGIDEAIAQLQSVALVYGLQETRPDGLIALSEIMNEVCASAEGLTGGTVEKARERKSSRPACVAGAEAVSVAVALNELVFNALKHQTGAGKKRARVTLLESRDSAEIRIANRGKLPKGFDFPAGRGVGDGLGLVRTLLAPPGGDVVFDGGRNEVQVVLKLRAPLLAVRQQTIAR